MQYRILTITSALLCSIGLSYGFTANQQPESYSDLAKVYQIASDHNATYKAAYETLQANLESIGIARGALLPNVSVSANLLYNYTNQPSAGEKEWYYSTTSQIALSQVLFNFALWSTYTQAQYQAKADAITYDQARQTLILSVANAYFGILQAEDNLKYAQASESWNAELLKQTQQKYDVGLAAITDVQSTKAQYEQSVAETIQAKNALENSYEAMAQITGTMITNVVPLKNNFPFAKPQPTNVNAWVDTAMKNNLTIVQNNFLVEVAKKGINVAWSAFLPYASLSASATNATSYQTVPDVTTKTGAIGATATLNILNGGSDYATVKQSQYSLKTAQYNLKQSQRDTESQLHQAYLNVIADISQVNAYNQAVIANESSLEAMKAQYDVGTSTIVDLLNQQQLLLQAQQQYAQSKYAYINDILTLKQSAGTLAPQDLISINKWLGLAPKPTKEDQKNTNNKAMPKALRTIPPVSSSRIKTPSATDA